MIPTLTLTKTTSGWWILGDDSGPMGPFDTRKEAESDRQGVLRFYHHPEDITSDRQPLSYPEIPDSCRHP